MGKYREVIVVKLKQLMSNLNLYYALAIVALCSLSYILSCSLHNNPPSAASLFSSAACSISVSSVIDFTSHHSADLLLNHHIQGEESAGDRGSIDVPDSSVPMVAVEPDHGAVRGGDLRIEDRSSRRTGPN